MFQQRSRDRPPILLVTVRRIHPVGELGSMDLAGIKECGEYLLLKGVGISGLDMLVQTLQQEAAEYGSLVDIEIPSSIETKVERDLLGSTRGVLGVLIERAHSLARVDAQLSQE